MIGGRSLDNDRLRTFALALQLGDVDINAALLGDGLDPSREIGVAQQILVAHFRGRLPWPAVIEFTASATTFSALSKHSTVIKTTLLPGNIANLPISHRI